MKVKCKNLIEEIKSRMDKIDEVLGTKVVGGTFGVELAIEYERLKVCLDVLEGKKLVR